MKTTLLLPLLILAAGLVSGCGDPAPSTKLAPDKPPLDASKLTEQQKDELLKNDKAMDRK